MNTNNFVSFLNLVLPRSTFKKLRRQIPLCEYNYHSAVKVASSALPRNVLPAGERCKHCGEDVYRDHKGEWRARVKVKALLSDSIDEFDLQLARISKTANDDEDSLTGKP